MSLRTELEISGGWLFRHRSFLPIGALPIIFSLPSYHFVWQSHALNEIGQYLGLMVSLLGLGVRVLAIGYAPEGTSGRNTKSQVADELNTTGMYSIVRHPLYLGNYMIMMGFLVALHNCLAFLLATSIFCLFYERIMLAEEAFLRKKYADYFERWAQNTRAFFPAFGNWTQPSIPFSWRTVLRREYTGLFLITSLFFLLDLVGDSIIEKHLIFDLTWVVIFILGLVSYVTLRALKKGSRILYVRGR